MLLRSNGGCLTGAPDGVATLEVRKGAFDALNKGSGALGKSEVKLSPPRGCPLKDFMSKLRRKGATLIRIKGRVLSVYCFACGSLTRFHQKGCNRTWNQSKPYCRPVQPYLGNNRNRTQSVLRQDMSPFLDRGAHKKFIENWRRFRFQTVRETVLEQRLHRGSETTFWRGGWSRDVGEVFMAKVVMLMLFFWGPEAKLLKCQYLKFLLIWDPDFLVQGPNSWISP